MSETLIVAIISSVVGGLFVAIVNQWSLRRRTNAEAIKLEAEAEKIKIENQKMLGDIEFESFERKLKQDMAPPRGWFLSSSDPSSYRVGIDRNVFFSGTSSGFIESIKKPRYPGTLMQKIRGHDFQGKRMRLSAYIKTNKVEDWASLWFRVDGIEKYALSFDNMKDRPIKGTTDWTGYEIVLDVPLKITKIAYGILLSGGGKVWIDSVKFDEVDENIPVTDLIDYKDDINIPDKPKNLDFSS